MARESKQKYTPARLAMVVDAVRQLADDIEAKAQAMSDERVASVLLGDAMLRRSYRHIEHFANALERAVRIETERRERMPWDVVKNLSTDETEQ